MLLTGRLDGHGLTRETEPHCYSCPVVGRFRSLKSTRHPHQHQLAKLYSIKNNYEKKEICLQETVERFLVEHICNWNEGWITSSIELTASVQLLDLDTYKVIWTRLVLRRCWLWPLLLRALKYTFWRKIIK